MTESQKVAIVAKEKIIVKDAGVLLTIEHVRECSLPSRQQINFD